MYLLVIISLFVVFSGQAMAWAPATHFCFAEEVLTLLHLLPSSISQVITAFASDFLYGTLAADITLGKAYVDYMYNCHNFDVGFGLLRHAKDESDIAFTYGYLAHLAADTVSHNYFVPYQNILHLDAAKFRHAYWEVRLDQYFGGEIWQKINMVVSNARCQSHDYLLDHALEDTFFSFKTNRILFSSMLSIQRLKKWQQFVKKINTVSNKQFNFDEISEYNSLAVSAVIRLLRDQKQSCVYLVDPTGKKTLQTAQKIRTQLKTLKKQKKLTQEYHQNVASHFRNEVKTKYFKDYLIDEKEVFSQTVARWAKMK